jgi:hypothetical protein
MLWADIAVLLSYSTSSRQCDLSYLLTYLLRQTYKHATQLTAAELGDVTSLLSVKVSSTFE